MVVMKFGGSSLASAASIGRVVSIVSSEASRHAVVVASAMGDATDCLLELLSSARRANSYCAWKLQKALRRGIFLCAKSCCLAISRASSINTCDRFCAIYTCECWSSVRESVALRQSCRIGQSA